MDLDSNPPLWPFLKLIKNVGELIMSSEPQFLHLKTETTSIAQGSPNLRDLMPDDLR